MKKFVFSIFIILGFFTLSGQNTAPVVSGIPDQSLGPCGTFVTITLDDYVSDVQTADADISWTYSGNTELLVNINNRIATITLPATNWYGSEVLTFTATDNDIDNPLSDSDDASFAIAQMGIPSVGIPTQPTCSVATGSVTLSGLPSTGTWTLTRTPGGTSTGSGTTTTVSGLVPGSYTWTVTSAAGCISNASTPAVINAQPLTPAAPTIGIPTQPTCSVGTGSVPLSGLPATGTWTLTRTPGGTSTGSGTTTTVSGLVPGSYTWTVTNAAGCTSPATAPAVINAQPLTPAAPTIGIPTQPTCSVATGSVTLSGLPSTGTWTLTRTPGGTSTGSGTTTTVSGLVPGSYTWTVTNAAGCTSPATAPAVINAQPLTPAAPTIGIPTQPTCSVATGSVTLSGLPSTGTWTLTRTPGGTSTGSGTTTTVSGLVPGSYTWTVTNAAGCISNASTPAVINAQPLTPAAPTIGIPTQPTCSVGTGSVPLSGLPATGTWTLTRTPGGTSTGSGTTTTVSGLVPGSYTWTVTNAAGCTSPATAPAVINAQPLTPAAPTIGIPTQPTCSVATGSVTLSGLPSTGTWTLTRTPGGTSTGSGTTTTVSGLVPGSYTWTVTNAAGCTSPATAPAVINAQPLTPAAPTIGIPTQPTCSVATGSVTLSGLPSTGTWTLTRTPGGTSTGSGTTTTVSGLVPGSYTWTVTNAAGCISNASTPAVINAQPLTPAAPTIGIPTQPTCSVGTGSVPLSGLPATGTWTLTRTPGGTSTGSGTTTTVSGLVPGSYTWTVTNAAGCTSPATAPAVINAQPLTPAAPTIGIPTQPTCSVATGSVTLSGLPSTGTWTLTRTPGGTSTGSGTTTTVSGLVPGSYTWTVTNAAGCTSPATAPAVINAQPLTPAAPTIGIPTQPTCSVGTGSVTLSGLPSTGTWTLTRTPGGTSTGSGTTTTVSGLVPGSYTWTVTNAAGCTSPATAPAVINAQPLTPAAPTIGIPTQPTCSVATGSVTLSGLPSTGTWTLTRTPGGTSTGSGTTTTVSGLVPGSYTWTVTNADGCISNASAPAVINAQPLTPAAPTIGIPTQPTCSVGTGSVSLSGLPSTGTWTLTRTPGGTSTGSGTTTTVSGLVPGSYTWTVTNADGCTSPASASAVINAQPLTPAAPTIGIPTQPTCSVATGSVTLSGLPSTGTWTLTRTPGGTSTGSGTTTTVSGLVPGSYTWTVTNASGCISPATAPAVINAQPLTPAAPTIGIPTQPTCSLATGSVPLSGLPSTGTWTLTRTPGGTSTGSGTTTTVSGLVPGSYTWTVTNADGCTSPASAPAVINAQPLTPAAPTIGIPTQPTCGVATGSVILNGLPSTGSWIVTESPGGALTSSTGTSTTISGLASGTRTFTVTNSDGCTSDASGSVVINLQPPTPIAPIVGIITQPTCGTATGSVVLSGLPGSGTWTLTRSPGGTTTSGTGTSTTISGLGSGTYTYTVRNSAGCTSSSSASVQINTQPVTPSAPVIGTITQPTCGLATGSVVLNGLPSSGTWTLTRSPGGATTTGTGTSTTISGLATGTYTYTVRNSVGCTSSSSASVQINTQPVTPGAPVVGTITQPTCGVPTGSVVLSGLPSSGTWTLTRSPGGATTSGTGTSTVISGLATGTYTYTVRNSVGCTSSSSASVQINTQPVTPGAPVIGTITQPTCGVSTGSVFLSGLPASGTWTLTRSPGGATTTGNGTSTTISGLGSGTYTYTVRNSVGCTSSSSASIQIYTQPVTPGAPAIVTITQPTCGVATGSVVLSGLPSSGTWTLTRSPGGVTTTGTTTITTISGLTAGTYSWTVRNADGCTSSGSGSAVINTQPLTPNAPVIGTITHPTCGVSTGSVVLSGLPASGTWTLTRSPGGSTTTGTGTSTTISGLSSGSYTYTVRNSVGCISSSSGLIVINTQPVTPSAPQIGTITQPTCSVGTGRVVLNGLPSSGSWVLTRYPGAITTNGSGTSLSIAGLSPNAYTFTITNSIGCTSQASAPVVINLQPETPTAPLVGTISQPTCYISSGSVVLSGLPESGTWTLERSPGGTTTTGTGAVSSVSGLAPGNYTFIVRNAQGCPSAASAEVRVNSQPTTPTSGIILGDSYTSCQGESVLLDAGTGFDTYSWNTGSGSRTINVGVTGTYSVTVTEGDCSASASANVTFNSIPQLDLGSTINACEGESVTLDAGSGFDSYRWTTEANSQTINVSQNGTYGVTIERDNCSNYDDVTVIFNSLPVIPLETSYYGTSCITLNAGNSGSTYQWNTGATSQTISACSTGTYSVNVTTPSSCSASFQTLVTIGEKPVVNLPEALSGCEGESIMIDAGSGFASYLWNTGATSQSINVSSSGTYSVIVTDIHNEQAMDDVPVTFNPLPLVDLGSDQTICQSESLQLSPGSGFISYSWNTGESTESISVTTSGVYSVTVNDGNCSASDQVSVQVKSEPAVDLGPDRHSCVGEIVILDAGSGYDAYSWSTGETSASIEVSTPGNYTVNVTNNGCSVVDDIDISFNPLPEVELGLPVSACDGDEVILNAGLGFSSYLWSTGDTSQSITVTRQDNYSVTVSIGNCSSSDELDVIFQPTPQPDLGPMVSSCEGEDPVLDAGPGYVSYLWSTGGTDQAISVSTPGTYSVSVSDGTCEGSDEVDVAFLEKPVVDLGPSITACEGVDVILDAGPGFDIYIWSTGETTQSIRAKITSEYLVSVNNRCGSTSDGVIVTIKESPDVDLGEDTSIDAGAQLLLNAGSGQRSYIWNTGATGSQILLSGLSDGVYDFWVAVTGFNFCQSSDTITVTVGEGTGIEESFLSRNIRIYPNPTKHRFFVGSNGNIQSDIIIKIYDASGKILVLDKWEDLSQNQPREIDVSEFKPGIYFVSFYSDKDIVVRKLIKY